MGAALVITILAGLAFWLWNDSLRAREAALRACAAACRRLDVQFLDQTVALERLGYSRAARAGLPIWRLYTFEFSADGTGRQAGHAKLLGAHVEYVHLDHPEHGSLFEAPGRD